MKNTRPSKKGTGSAPFTGFPGYDDMDAPSLEEASAGVAANIISSQQLIAQARRELELTRRLRLRAEQYLRETEIKARSEAQQLIFQARMTVRREIEDLLRQANEEITKILSDIRVIRITAREELAAQKKFTDAARLRSFTLSLQQEESDTGSKDTGKKHLKKPSNN